jgi:hypothetical protein
VRLGIETSKIFSVNARQVSRPRSGAKMRDYFLLVLFALLGAVQAISSVGNRLLVVLEDESEKSSFSQFWTDLEGA